MQDNQRKIFIYIILAICIIAIMLVLVTGMPKKSEKKEEKKIDVIDTALLTENFHSIFDNTINYQNNTFNFNKKNTEKELVYTAYSLEDEKEGQYQLNINIPYLNIRSNIAEKINNEINELFYKKTSDILTNSKKKTIYNVKYKAYLNDNIVSLIISCTLKEGENAQREIMKTYNYNLSSNSELNIKEILEYKGIQESYVQDEINETIEISSNNAKQYRELGYNKYLRDINDSMYKLENTKVYFLGESKALYIVYPYGNFNYTSELDLLVM